MSCMWIDCDLKRSLVGTWADDLTLVLWNPIAYYCGPPPIFVELRPFSLRRVEIVGYEVPSPIRFESWVLVAEVFAMLDWELPTECSFLTRRRWL